MGLHQAALYGVLPLRMSLVRGTDRGSHPFLEQNIHERASSLPEGFIYRSNQSGRGT